MEEVAVATESLNNNSRWLEARLKYMIKYMYASHTEPGIIILCTLLSMK